MATCSYCGDYCSSFVPFRSISDVGQLVSVISLLSSDTPNTESPANVDAAKEVRTDIQSNDLSESLSRLLIKSLQHIESPCSSANCYAGMQDAVQHCSLEGEPRPAA